MERGRPRKIVHVDMDAFFASGEQRDNPSLRGRPVAVGHAAARGVVAAASYEARTFGVRSALPSVTAMRRCPNLIIVPPRFGVYRAVSQQIHEIFAEFTDLIQPLSLDEAYLDVTAGRQDLPTAWLTAKAIRARILEETGLTASAGISYNKFLAKLASDHRKPNGQFAVTPDMGATWVETLPVSRFHGVGPVTAAKMERLGITTGAHLRAKSMDFLIDHFGSLAGWYHAIARGKDDRPVNPHRERKSSGSETTSDRDLTEPAQIEAGVLRMADDVWAWCARRQTFGRRVSISSGRSIRWKGDQTGGGDCVEFRPERIGTGRAPARGSSGPRCVMLDLFGEPPLPSLAVASDLVTEAEENSLIARSMRRASRRFAFRAGRQEADHILWLAL